MSRFAFKDFPMTIRVHSAVAPLTRLLASTALTGLFALGSPVLAQGLPTGGTVAAGAASIATGADQLTITQTSAAAALNWNSFSIGQGKNVTFVQPTAQSVALNRVLGSDPSVILGSLNANGKVFLVNPNGVLFGQSAQVNVGGLVASTLGLSDADFMAGRYGFAGTSGAAVLNQGAITARDGGFVALLGANVSNQGVIVARLGTVALAAGEAVTLDVAGDGLLNITVDTGAVNALAGNGGLIRADGGNVVLTAQAAGQLLHTVVNNSGVIEARTLDSRNGTVRLLGDAASGSVAVDGTIDVTAGTGQAGGAILVTGHAVDLASGSRLDASGSAGGGTILIGGGYRGQNARIAHAAGTTMARDATIRADAGQAGNGGTVVLWSDGLTQVDGAISARGGALSGNGGLVETSGRSVALGTTARVDTLAPNGATGLWLLDPLNYTIAIAGGDETPGQVTVSLATSDRLIEATNNITVSDAIIWTTPQTLELRAGNDVLINAAMTASTAGSLMRLTAGRDVAVDGALTASGNGSLIEINTGRDIVLNEAVTASGGGAVMFRADADGTGGPAGGTVRLSSIFPVTSTSKTIYYSPENGYAAPNLYTGFTAFMWVFVGANDKQYDGTVAATARFRGDPTVGGTNDVVLNGGTIAFVDKNVGPAKPVNFTGYSIDGADAGLFALFADTGQTTAAITPAALTITANNASKLYGQTITLPGTAFTSNGLVGGDTVGSVTLVSAGRLAGAPVAGSPYAIRPSAAVGGTFAASNYVINYVNGVLTIAPRPLVITANDATKVYGDSLTFTGSEFTAAGLVNGDVIGAVTQASTGAIATADVDGGTYAITASNAVGGTYTPSNYATTYVSGGLTVTPAVLLVTANDASKTVGTTYVFDSTAFEAVGLKNGDTIAGVTASSAGAIDSAPVDGSPYVITTSAAIGGSYRPANYTIGYGSGALTVLAAATPPVVTPPVVTPPDVTPPVVTPPTEPPVVTPPVEPPVVTPPVVTPPVVTPPVEPPVVTPPVVTPPVEPPVVEPPIPPIPADGAGPVGPSSATLVRETSNPAALPVGAPAGVDIAVQGGGVRMPATQLALADTTRPEIAGDTPTSIAAPATARGPAPVRGRAQQARVPKQDRN
jgi:filamentous hemagglutinin family protein